MKRFLKRKSMESNECETSGSCDATIYLMKYLSMEEQSENNNNDKTDVNDNDKKKCKDAHRIVLGKVKVKEHKLRQYSTYFCTCMSERSASTENSPSSKLEFHLEVHTEVQYYEDCFSRMHSLHKPIPNVAYCIELMKVAAQIGFQDVFDIGVMYLTIIPWSDHDETLVREFYSSSHLILFSSMAELERFRFALNPKNMFTRYLEDGSKFAMALHVVMSSVETQVVGDKVLEHVVAFLTQALVELVSCLENEVKNFSTDSSTSVVENALSSMCWLFQVARDAKVSQALVVKLTDVGFGTATILFFDSHRALKLIKLVELLYAIFCDVLEGKIVLDSQQRSLLFARWHWVMFLKFEEGQHEKHLDFQALAMKFTLTLPPVQQKYFLESLIMQMEFCEKLAVCESVAESLARRVHNI